jgi:2'-5' RNA ligase
MRLNPRTGPVFSFSYLDHLVQQTFAANWEHFTRLRYTSDSIASERRGWRRWLLMPYVGFIIPVEDMAVTAQLVEWQAALQAWFQYDPQPAQRFHITLHYVGGFANALWRIFLPYRWQRKSLDQLAQRIRPTLEAIEQFEVGIGPLNAFDNALFAEAQDSDDECLRHLKLSLRRALPLRARPPTSWRFLPHVTLGFWGSQPVAPLVEALRPYREVEPLPLVVQTVLLTIYTRDSRPHRRSILRTANQEVVAEFHLKPSERR